jgi:hypothetical protein
MRRCMARTAICKFLRSEIDILCLLARHFCVTLFTRNYLMLSDQGIARVSMVEYRHNLPPFDRVAGSTGFIREPGTMRRCVTWCAIAVILC